MYKDGAKIQKATVKGKQSSSKAFPDIENVTIRSVLFQAFRRPYVSVSPDTPLVELGTYLSTGHQIYVDGLIVAQENKLAGRIGGQHILDRLLRTTYDDWSRITASDLMEKSSSALQLDSSLSTLLRLFGETKFALAPIADNGQLIGSVGIRDLLPVISESKLRTGIMTVGSTQVRLKRDETLGNAIDIMLKKGIRNLVLSSSRNDVNDKDKYIINDRKMLEFIFSYEGKKVMTRGIGSSVLANIRVDSLDIIAASHISQKATVRKAANLLRDSNTPVLLFDNQIITPWDIVMKTMWNKN